MGLKKANKIEEIFSAVMTQPISIEDMDQFYCNTDAARNNHSTRNLLARAIRKNAIIGNNAHILFVGYRGCGKSTELNHLQKDLQGEFMVLNYSVMKELDPQSINYIELFIVTMERLFTLAVDNNLAIEPEFLKKIGHWSQSKEITEIKDKHISAELEVGSETNFVIPYFQKLFIKLKGAAKISKSFKETIKENIEPRLSELIDLCNELISEVRMQLVGKGYKDLLIFVEDLDKIPNDRAQAIFYNYASQLTQLKSPVVYTFPVGLYYNTQFGSIRGYFNNIVELPMVKTHHKDGADYPDGIAILEDIIDKRINPTLFATKAIKDKFIMACGGVIRDLFTMINAASDIAESEGSALINEQHFDYAFRLLKNEYDHTIADYHDNSGKILYTAKDLNQKMVDLIKSEDKQPDHSDIMLLLRQNLCVLSYNGEGWCDVHPAMKQVLIDRKYLD